MVENVGGNNSNSGKIWTKIMNATTDQAYIQGLNAKVNSIMKGNKTVNINQLRQDPVYANMDKETFIRFNKIAGLDGNATSFSRDELLILYALSDAKLVDGKFEFDLKWDNTEHSALKEATTKSKNGELEAFVNNLTPDNSEARHIRKVDTSTFEKSKPLDVKLKSDNPNEVMTAINDETMTDYINPKTGKKMPITEVVTLVSNFVNENQTMSTDEICSNIQKEYGIPISDYGKYKEGGDYYTIGDWKIYSDVGKKSQKTISNSQTGVGITGTYARWCCNTIDTIPNTTGSLFMINTFSDNDGNTVKFKTQNEIDTIQPSGATIYNQDGTTQNIKYDIEETVDPSIYGFIPFNE